MQDRGLKAHIESLIEEARQLLDAARLLPPGALRNEALKKARQAEVAAHIEDGIKSAGLPPPKDHLTIGEFFVRKRTGPKVRAAQEAQRMQAQVLEVRT